MIVAGVFWTNMGQSDGSQISIEQVQTDTSLKGKGTVIVFERGVYTSIKPAIQVDVFVDVEYTEEPKVIEWHSEVKDITVRIEDIVPRIDGLRAHRVGIFSDFEVES